MSDEPEASYVPLIERLPDHIALSCLARVPRKDHKLLKLVSKRWRDLVCSEEWRVYRKQHNLDETWIYALCIEKNTDQLCCYQLDPSLGSKGMKGCWKLVPHPPSQCLKRKGMAFESVGKRLYLLGGCALCEDANKEVYCYDTAMNAWSQVSSMSTPRCYFGCETVDEKIYAMGGYGLKRSEPHSWDIYDTISNTCESHSDPNIILSIENSVVMDGKIYIKSCASPILAYPVSIAAYDPSTGQWIKQVADMASGWHGPAIVVDGTLFMLDQSSIMKLMMWCKDTREWIIECYIPSGHTIPPCQMVAINQVIFIIGEGLSTLALNFGDIGDDRVVQGYSLREYFDNIEVIRCQCVSI